ncbi:LysR family transcriptional regulator [Rhodobacteraceae bacterium 2CG4]|uniref:LysR family transcriptional regulator n=1 Tax=Halovulum marinum TaxID=2662447 RepID=A0A6L5YW57_9RHOB|nr:LysR substrate-binding domain-containing protein [Halovulum marinum]MSU88586.1 LysR family transcriptional regulator [Halovulum marinum]
MSRRFYGLPPLTTLAAFESAARNLSFKNAATELNVTPGAVSHQIKALEGELGAALFIRRHRGVELTEDGHRLFGALAEAFVRISQNLRDIRQRNSISRVTLGATSAVASLWTAQLLAGFWHEHPDITVDQHVSDSGFGPAGDIDMFIRYGRDANAALDHHPLFRDELIPVAAPTLAARLPDPDLAELAAERLIYLDSFDQSWTRWSDWFAALQQAPPSQPGLRVNNYMIALYAAKDGQGVALGWRRLIDPMLRRGDLATVGRHSVPAPRRFYLVTRPEAELSPGALLLRDWLVANLHELNSPEG